MSRSGPLPSSIVERGLPGDRPVQPAAAKAPPRGRKLRTRVAAFMRWVHVYVSLFGLAIVLFFSATGLTLNHPDWFFGEAERSVRSEGRLEPKWLDAGVPETASSDSGDSTRVAKLEVVEHLRKTHGIRGALAEFRVDGGECAVTFKGPGTSADAFIDRNSGQYSLVQTDHGLIAVFNDLHKGRDTGRAWSAVIDVSAIALIVISLSGLVLLLYIKRRRIPGLLAGLAGALVVAVVYWVWVE